MRPKDHNKQLAICDAAIEMITTQGFDGLSMKKLAKTVGISPSTIYVYFQSREDLLNKVYQYVEAGFEAEVMTQFSPDMSFSEGLWQQWKNRYEYALKYPVRYLFSNQFRNSPLIQHPEHRKSNFRDSMGSFVRNAVRNKELIDLPPALYWSLAYGPLYILIGFHLDQGTMAGKPFSLTEAKLKTVFNRTLEALKPGS